MQVVWGGMHLRRGAAIATPYNTDSVCASISSKQPHTKQGMLIARNVS